MESSTKDYSSETVRPSRTASIRSNILFAFAVGLVLFLVYWMREILFMLYVSALFAIVLMPVIRWIMQLRIRSWHPGRGTAILLLLAAVFGGATLFFTVAATPLVRDLSQFTKELPTRGPELLNHLRRLPFSSRLEVATLNAKVQGFASNFIEYFVLSISGWAGRVADIATVIVLTIYFMLEGDIAYRWALSLFPGDMRTRLDSTLLRAETRMGKWLLAQGLLMLTLGVLSTIVFVLLKIRYAYLLGVMMGVLNIIPVVGGLISMVLVVLVAAIDSWGKVLGALIFYVIYVQFETSYLTPRVMQNRVNLAGLTVLVALLIGSKLGGIVGAMVAVPTAVLVTVLIQEYLVQQDALPDRP